jgi:2-oxoglutarate ferredoxin oxidoreductase subunit gamma
MTERILIAGAGGQGILFIGKLMAGEASKRNKYVTFFPSYGAEVRGGTCHCQIILSSNEIASPVAEEFDSMILMNQQSADRFINQLTKDGLGFINSSLCKMDKSRNLIMIDATNIAAQSGNKKATNLLMLGSFLAYKKIFPPETVEKQLHTKFSESNPQILDINIKAFRYGLQSNHLAN